MSRKPMLAVGVAAVLALSGAVAAQAQVTQPSGTSSTNEMNQSSSQKLSQADQQFLKEAVQADLAEVKVGELAQQKGQSQEVKQFGQTLQQDHSQNLQQAQQLAQQYGMTPPTAPNAQQKQMYDRLSKLSGTKFDQQFAKDMVQDHKKDIAKFQAEAKKQNDPLAQYAQQTVPVLQKHLQMAQEIANQGATTGSKPGRK